MKLIKSLFITILAITTLAAFTTQDEILTSSKTHIWFFSSTPVEDITAHNYKAISTLDADNGEVVFSVPMQSFEFEKALMQKHFNGKDFLDTKGFPKAKFVGKVSDISKVDFSKAGTYPVTVEGDMTIKGKTNSVSEPGTIEVGSDGTIHAKSKFDLTLSDYGIAFEKGKPSTNIAKTIEINFEGEYTK